MCGVRITRVLVNLHIDMGRASASAAMACLVYCRPAQVGGLLVAGIERWMRRGTVRGVLAEGQYPLMYAIGHSLRLLESTSYNEKTWLHVMSSKLSVMSFVKV